MRVTLDPSDLPAGGPAAGDPGAVVSVGVFDGVHLGHLAILETNVFHAKRLGARATVVTFRRHPKTVLLGRAPRILTTLEHRLALFARAGIEHSVVLAFDERLRDTSAGEFVEDLLVGRLGARCFVLGFDSKFGRDREGGIEFLRARGHAVEVAPKVMLGERAVSSTAIREAVELGDLAGAARMLGRPVAVLGQVVHGEALGRRLGFPTANLDLHHELHPPNGVYACRARIVPAPLGDGAPDPRPSLGEHDAVANIGQRPTLAAPERAVPLVEVHLLDFDGDLYGDYLELEFVERIRDELRFGSLDALREQIARDVASARRALRGAPTGGG